MAENKSIPESNFKTYKTHRGKF